MYRVGAGCPCELLSNLVQAARIVRRLITPDPAQQSELEARPLLAAQLSQVFATDFASAQMRLFAGGLEYIEQQKRALGQQGFAARRAEIVKQW